jgi:predicted N-acetyltransferase YhbS
MDINYRIINIDELNKELLSRFNRFQETKRVWYKEDEHYKLKDDYFTEQWEDEKKNEVILSLKQSILTGGFVVGAFMENRLIGFANVEGDFFGKHQEYLELAFIHVSKEWRDSGIGKKLFKHCCEKAKQLGAKKLYIAAHPAEETQQFYQSVGCRYATEINQSIYDKEPLDIQLEIDL